MRSTHCGIVVRRRIDPGADGIDGHGLRRTGLERNAFALEPGVELPRVQDHRHPMVHRRHGLVGGGGENGAGLDRVARSVCGERIGKDAAVRHRPALPQSGEREHRAVLETDQPRLPRRAAARPFVESVGGNEATPGAERGTESGLGACGLGAGVDELVADAHIPGPAGNEAPAHHRQHSAVLARANRRDLLARCDVVSGAEIARRSGQSEEGMHLAPREPLRESSAHGSDRSPVE